MMHRYARRAGLGAAAFLVLVALAVALLRSAGV